MRTLILGASGLIGSHLAAACSTRDFDWVGTSLRGSDFINLDVRNSEAVREIVNDTKPDVTFLAAGLPSSDYAEAFPEECDAVVTRGTRNVAAAVAATGGRLVSFHTDELFHTARTARVEDATPAPGNAFARAHLAAENCIRELLPTRHLIARTSWVYGPESRRCPANAILRRLRRHDECLADANLHGHPTYAPDLAEVALQLAQVGETGTLHLAGPDPADQVHLRPAGSTSFRPRRGVGRDQPRGRHGAAGECLARPAEVKIARGGERGADHGRRVAGDAEFVSGGGGGVGCVDSLRFLVVRTPVVSDGTPCGTTNTLCNQESALRPRCRPQRLVPRPIPRPAGRRPARRAASGRSVPQFSASECRGRTPRTTATELSGR